MSAPPTRRSRPAGNGPADVENNTRAHRKPVQTRITGDGAHVLLPFVEVYGNRTQYTIVLVSCPFCSDVHLHRMPWDAQVVRRRPPCGFGTTYILFRAERELRAPVVLHKSSRRLAVAQ